MIKSLEIRNFKAIEQAKIKLTPLTAFIGYNGMGKSSVLEALEMFRAIVTEGLDSAVRPWREFEHIYHKGGKNEKGEKRSKRKFQRGGLDYQFAPMYFSFQVNLKTSSPLNPQTFSSSIGQETSSAANLFFIEETVGYKQFKRTRNADGDYLTGEEIPPGLTAEKRGFWRDPDKSILSAELELRRFVESWQFLSMNTFLMGEPQQQKKTAGSIQLQKDGRNIAEYVLSIREKDAEAYQGILETLQYVLPYAADLQPQITQELEKRVYLQLTEQDFKLPGWVLSTGTLKILALLAVFRHPEPSPLIVIEEVENGLDPRTIHLVVSEIRNYLDNKKGQVLLTTHSPYLLDQLNIKQLVFVERKNEKVFFSRPGDNEEVLEWSKKFAPGQLYTQKGFSN